MTDMTGVAKECFQVLLRFDYSVKLYDQDGMTVAEPTEARRMFAASPNLMVSLNDADDDSSIKLLFGKSTHANDIDGLMQALRTTATKYNMTFEPKQYGKEIDAKDYQNLMSVSESKKENQMQLCEGMYGTSRSSYLQLDNAKLIVHHDERLRASDPGARARHIGSIFVENAAGERRQFPTAELAKARQLTEHLNAGGTFDDATATSLMAVPKPPTVNARTLAENNPVVQDFLRWTERFAPDRALLEWNDPDSKVEDHYEEAEDMMTRNFDVGEFLASSEWHDTLGGRSADPNDGEHELDKREVLSALAYYITNFIQSHSDYHNEHGYDDDSEGLAQHFYPQVAQAIEHQGYAIHADDAAPTLEAAPESEEFTREDILLLHPNQADSLSGEVSKAVVHDDPADRDEEHAPDVGYLSRMKTLAGVNSSRPV